MHNDTKSINFDHLPKYSLWRPSSMKRPGVFSFKWPFIIFSILTGLFIPYLIIVIANNADFPEIWSNTQGYLALVAITAGPLLVWNWDKKQRSDFFKFIDENGFKPGITLRIPPESIPFFYGLGHSRRRPSGFSGVLFNYQFDVFNYVYSTGGGKNKKDYRFTVFHFRIPKRVPHIVLDSLKNDQGGKTVTRLFSNDQRYELEGDFPKHFKLYGPKQYEADVLDILSPDFMAHLIDKQTAFDIEMDDHEVYLISRQNLYSESKMRDLFEAAEELMQQIDNKMRVWQMSYVAHTDPVLESYSAPVVSFGNKKISSTVFVFLAVGAVLTFFLYFTSQREGAVLVVIGGLWVAILVAVGVLLHLGPARHRS